MIAERYGKGRRYVLFEASFRWRLCLRNTGRAERGWSLEHKDFLIIATPYSEGGQYQVCGVISKTIDGEVKEYRFVRADRCPGIEDAASIALNKGRQIIDEQGERIFG